MSRSLPESLSILMIDDHPVVRQGVRAMLNAVVDDLNFFEAGAADRGLQILEERGDHPPDVVVVDLQLAESPGLDLVSRIRGSYPDLPILVLSMHPQDVFARRALEVGASGYVMKEEGGPVLLKALETVLRGELYLTHQAALQVIGAATGKQSRKGSRTGNFTKREFEIWTLLGRGVTRHDIARRLEISRRTVDSHCYNIRRKAGIESSSELVHTATRWVEKNGSEL